MMGTLLNRGWKGKLEQAWRSLLLRRSLTTTRDLAVDLGTAHTRIYLPREGIVIDEPSIIALDTESGKFIAVGGEAKIMSRNYPRSIRLVRPIQNGVISDCTAAGQMLSQFITLALANRSLVCRGLLICTSADLTQMEQAVYEEIVREVSAKQVTFIEEPYAAAVGTNLNLNGEGILMIVGLGAGTSDIGVISGGNLLYASTRRVGGCDIDNAILRYMHLVRALEITEDTAEEIKIGLGAVNHQGSQKTIVVRGRNLVTGLPGEITVANDEILPLIQPSLRVIKQHIHTALVEIPASASVGILDSGITLNGGLAQLPGLAEHFSEEFGLHVRVAPEPMSATVLGLGHLLEQKYHASIQGALQEQRMSDSDRESSLANI